MLVDLALLLLRYCGWLLLCAFLPSHTLFHYSICRWFIYGWTSTYMVCIYYPTPFINYRLYFYIPDEWLLLLHYLSRLYIILPLQLFYYYSIIIVVGHLWSIPDAIIVILLTFVVHWYCWWEGSYYLVGQFISGPFYIILHYYCYIVGAIIYIWCSTTLLFYPLPLLLYRLVVITHRITFTPPLHTFVVAVALVVGGFTLIFCIVTLCFCWWFIHHRCTLFVRCCLTFTFYLHAKPAHWCVRCGIVAGSGAQLAFPVHTLLATPLPPVIPHHLYYTFACTPCGMLYCATFLTASPFIYAVFIVYGCTFIPSFIILLFAPCPSFYLPAPLPLPSIICAI